MFLLSISQAFSLRLFLFSLINNIFEAFKRLLLVFSKLIIQERINIRIMEHILHLLRRPGVIELICEHRLILLPAHQELSHLVFICLVQVEAELLLNV